MPVKNQAEMKDSNIRHILRTMLRNGPISRADICKKTGLTPSAMSALTRHLLKERVIEELGPEGKPNGAGRPPSLLQLVGRSYAAVGVEIGVNHLYMGVVSMTGDLLDKANERFPVQEKPEGIFSKIISYFTSQKERLTKEGVRLTGLGVAVTGLVDPESGINRFAPNLGWRDVNVKNTLTSDLNSPVVVDNNVRLMALGEEWFGAARNSGSLIFVQVGHGVGCGIVLPKTGLLRGTFNGGGELGHCTVLPGGPQCRCGKRGCLEALVSESAVISSYLQRVAVHPHSQVNPSDLTVDAIVERAAAGDETAQGVLKEAAGFLGIGLATLINIFEPRQIILNGNALVLSPYTRAWIEESTREHCFNEMKVHFSNASFRNYQGVMGAATAVLKDQVF